MNCDDVRKYDPNWFSGCLGGCLTLCSKLRHWIFIGRSGLLVGTAVRVVDDIFLGLEGVTVITSEY